MSVLCSTLRSIGIPDRVAGSERAFYELKCTQPEGKTIHGKKALTDTVRISILRIISITQNEGTDQMSPISSPGRLSTPRTPFLLDSAWGPCQDPETPKPGGTFQTSGFPTATPTEVVNGGGFSFRLKSREVASEDFILSVDWFGYRGGGAEAHVFSATTRVPPYRHVVVKCYFSEYDCIYEEKKNREQVGLHPHISRLSAITRPDGSDLWDLRNKTVTFPGDIVSAYKSRLESLEEKRQKLGEYAPAESRKKLVDLISLYTRRCAVLSHGPGLLKNENYWETEFTLEERKKEEDAISLLTRQPITEDEKRVLVEVCDKTFTKFCLLEQLDNALDSAINAHWMGVSGGSAGEVVAECVAVSITKSLASALSFCHAKGVFHSDVKPANVAFEGVVADSGRFSVPCIKVCVCWKTYLQT